MTNEHGRRAPGGGDVTEGERSILGSPIFFDPEPIVGYFGPADLRKPHEVQVPTPVGATCTLCDETIVDGDVGTVIRVSLGITHYECVLRTAIGSLAHVEHRCSCFVPGSTEGDPPGMTYRQAALAAAVAFHERGGAV